MPQYTLRRLVLSEKTSKEPYHELIQNIEDLRQKIDYNYLETVLKRTTDIDDDIIIAVENKT